MSLSLSLPQIQAASRELWESCQVKLSEIWNKNRRCLMHDAQGIRCSI
jgi:hypothetical protein